MVATKAVRPSGGWHRLPLILAAIASTASGDAIEAGDVFGPDGCIALTKSTRGTCVLTTKCERKNISGVDFAFVCMNPGTEVPHALHSFGRGGFLPNEQFDTNVQCLQCRSVDDAFEGGSTDLRSALQAMPLGKFIPKDNDNKIPKPKEAAFFGPSACISTFRSPAGTCVLQTRCSKVNVRTFDVGVTCLDAGGDYTRYLFGKGALDPEETFDTRLECKACLGVGDEPTLQMHGVLPKTLIQDVDVLKSEVRALRAEVIAINQGTKKKKKSGFPGRGGGNAAAGGEAETEAHGGAHATPSPQAASDGSDLAPAPSMAAAPAAQTAAGAPAAGAVPQHQAKAAAAPGQAPLAGAPAAGGHHSLLAAAPNQRPPQMQDVRTVEGEPVIVHSHAPPPGTPLLHELLRRIAGR